MINGQSEAIFISGIGGTGMGPLAELALDAGLTVVGSDLKHTPQTAELERRGVKIIYQQTAAAIAETFQKTPFGWFIHSSAIPNDAAELQFVRTQHIRHSKRDEFLADFIERWRLDLIAVAGTHGKTTTTSMLTWVFHELHRPISYSIGSTIPFGPAGHYDSVSRFFIYEADEYDRNFLAYHPAMATVVSLDYDHADIYPTIESYRAAFTQFLQQSSNAILWRDVASQLDLADVNCEIIDKADRQRIDLPGQKVRENAELVVEILRRVLDDFDEIGENKIRAILARFPGADRRFEKLADNLYSDYAHTPAEITATLQKAREIARPDQKIVALYQPHQNARQLEIVREGGYKNAFTEADELLWLPTYLNRLDLAPDAPAVLSPEALIATMNQPANARAVDNLNDNTLAILRDKLVDQKSLVVALGAGTIDGWLRNNLAKLIGHNSALKRVS